MGMRKLARRCQIIDFPLVSARHTERSRTHAMHWSRHRSPGQNIDEFFRSPNQEVRFFLGLGACAVRPGPEGPLASFGYNDEISRVCLCTANSGQAQRWVASGVSMGRNRRTSTTLQLRAVNLKWPQSTKNLTPEGAPKAAETL